MFQRAALAALLISGAPAVHAQRRGGGGLSGGSSGGSSGGINSQVDRTPTSSESSASCSISVDTRATSSAENAYADMLVESFNYFCTGQQPDGTVIAFLEDKAKAVAEVMISFKTKCTATGDAWACGEAWAGASAFAAACYDIAITAIAELDTSACDCSTDVFLSTFVTAEAIGSLLAGISAGADVSACVEGSGDINPTEVNEVEVLKCTAESVAIITFGAIADAWVDSDCKQGFPAAICDNCCTEDAGDATCDCEVCIEFQNERAGALVAAFTDVSHQGGAICTETIKDVLTGAVQTSILEVPDEDFISEIHEEVGGGAAVCEVGAESAAFSLAVNAHASASAQAIIGACGGSITDAPHPFEAEAAAIAAVYQSAFADCFVLGDGASGCGYAESFGTAFAAACASASADAIAAIKPEDCDCGGDLQAVATAYAAESTKIFAAVSQVVGANACVDDETPNAFSEIMRTCSTETYALASASAVAKAWASAPECRPPPKKCVNKCQDAGEHKDECIAGCSAEQWRSAEVSASAHAQIDVESSTICSGSSVGDVWFADFGDGGEEQDLTAGAVQATLRWSGDADLDLYVEMPGGEIISYENPGPNADGGTLEFDTIPSCGVPFLNVENTFWPAGAPAGTYTAWAQLFSNDNCDGALPIDFTLVLKIGGQTVETLPGSFSTSAGGQMSAKLTGTL